MKLDQSESGKWGDFNLMPKVGWKISQEFIDFESKLLWVSESVIDTSKIEPDQYGNRFVPTNSYVISLDESRILPPEEWRTKFDYSIKEYFIEGADFKLMIQRKPMPDTNQDLIDEKLIHLKDGSIYSQSSGLAFRKEKRKNAYEKYLENLENQKRRLAKTRSQLSLEHFYHDCYTKLNSGDTILMYKDKNNFPYKIKITNQYELYLEKGTEIPDDYGKWSEIKYTKIGNYNSIKEFWESFTSDEFWFEYFFPFWVNHKQKLDNNILAYYILHEGNSVRHSLAIDWRKYRGIKKWENLFELGNLNPTEIIQVCSSCMDKVRFNPRYPTYICGKCRSELTDKSGRKVNYFNTAMMGYGCEGKYIGSDEKYNSSTCYIGEKEFYAMEARFGGIVIQLKSGLEHMI